MLPEPSMKVTLPYDVTVGRYERYENFNWQE